MTAENAYPLWFGSPTPPGTRERLRDPLVTLAADFFQSKGLPALKAEDREERWYDDWIAYQARHGLYAGLLSPSGLSSRGNRFDLGRLTRFLEAMAYFSPAHAYSLHVSFLGLFPILLGDREPLRREAIARLEAGGLFAFAVSEKEHGADLFSNGMELTDDGAGGFRASGSKYYIGNANKAEMLSVLGKAGGGASGQRAPFVFFAVRSGAGLTNLTKIRTTGIRGAFVGGFELRDVPVAAGDVFCRGRDAWDAVFSTVNIGKFFLGFGSIGMCAAAFAEAWSHVRTRVLYGRPVASMPHIRRAMTTAFARLVAMKLYALRALDHLQAGGEHERRHLLFNAIQKTKVGADGVRVIAQLSECMGARGFESDTRFETALREAPLIPALEGSTHVNFAMIAPFIEPYFRNAGGAPVAFGVAGGDDVRRFHVRDRNAKSVRFAPHLSAYEPLRRVPDVATFVEQVEAFRAFHAEHPDAAPAVAMGKCFRTIPYGKLIAEHIAAIDIEPALTEVIFASLVEDLTADALELAGQVAPGAARDRLMGAVRVPRADAGAYEQAATLMERRYPTG